MRYLRILSAIALGMFFAVPLAFALPPVTATNLVCTRCVHFSDLAYNVVKSVNILNDSILNDDISATAAISPSKILGIAWTAINDGPGSGLNADLLDGLDSLQFLRSDVSGTLNGNLNVNGLIGALGGGLTSGNSETTFALENTGTGGQPWLIRSTNDTSGHGGGKLVFDIGGVAKAVVTPDAKFGVGTASPANNLDVVSGGNTKALIHANDGINDRNPELELRAGNTDAGAHSILKFSKTAGTAFEKLRIQNGSSADILTLVGNGNVGIGTSNPGHRLEINGPGGSTMALSTIDGYGPSLNFGGGTSFKILASNVSDSVGSNKFVLSNVGSAANLLTVDYTGNVGVDTTNPGAKLEVADGGILVNEGPVGNPFVKLIGDFATEGLNIWYENNTGHSFIDNIYSAGNLYLRTNNGATNGITIFNNGAVATAGNLDVNGVVTSGWSNVVSGNSEANVEINNTGAGGVDWLIRSTNNSSGHGGGKLVFDIGGVMKAAVTAAGNFSVNGDVIGSRLCIASDCRTVWPSGSSSGGNVSGSGTADRLAKWTGTDTLGNSPVYIDSGNVGIDVPVPGKKLDVNGGLRVSNGIYGPESNPLTFFTDPASGPEVERMRIGAAGNVGIGTTGPDAPLNVSSNVVSDQGVLHVNATSGSGSTRGIYAEAGSNGSNSTAVFGIQTNSSPVSAGGTFGVLGRTLRRLGTTGNSSAAVFGDAIGGGDDFLSPPDADNQPDPFNALANGVQGETWSTNGSAAGGRFYANQGSGSADGVYGQTSSSASGSYGVYASGSMGATGTKSAVVYTESQGPTELYVVESPEIWFEDIGMGRLENGRANVALDPLFLETVTIDDNHPPHVFVQMYDDVTAFVKLGKPGFEVIEKDGGTSNAMFSYRIVAKRRYYEDYRLRPVPNTIDQFMRPDLSLDELKALNQKFGFHFEDFNDRDPSFYKR